MSDDSLDMPRVNSASELLPRPPREQNTPARSIDQFYEEAGQNDTTSQAMQYWIIMLALGIAHSGDATEILSMNFVLSNEGFAGEILKGDFKHRGSILAACVFAGMLMGGLFVSRGYTLLNRYVFSFQS